MISSIKMNKSQQFIKMLGFITNNGNYFFIQGDKDGTFVYHSEASHLVIGDIGFDLKRYQSITIDTINEACSWKAWFKTNCGKAVLVETGIISWSAGIELLFKTVEKLTKDCIMSEIRNRNAKELQNMYSKEMEKYMEGVFGVTKEPLIEPAIPFVIGNLQDLAVQFN